MTATAADDVAVYRQNAGGQNFFYYRASSNNPNGNITFVPWGSGEFVRPHYGDYDGDGIADFCIYDSAGVFSLLKSGGGIEYIQWGQGATETLVPGDFDGDGKYDFCVVRNVSNLYNWYILERDGGGTGARRSFGELQTIVTRRAIITATANRISVSGDLRTEHFIFGIRITVR